MKYKFALAFGLSAVMSIATVALAQGKPEDLIKYRQSAFAFMSWNMGKIKANVQNPERYNKDEVVAAANAIAGVANSGLSALFAPGTDKGTGWAPTRLKPEYFQEPEKAREIGLNFTTQASELAKVAASGDPAAVKAQFAKVGDACKRCHDSFRAKKD